MSFPERQDHINSCRREAVFVSRRPLGDSPKVGQGLTQFSGQTEGLWVGSRHVRRPYWGLGAAAGMGWGGGGTRGQGEGGGVLFALGDGGSG